MALSMKFLIVLITPTLALAARPRNWDNFAYRPHFDDLISERHLQSTAYLRTLLTCFVGSKCPDMATTYFKGILREAIQQGCAKCTKKQKFFLKKFLLGLHEAPEEYFQVFRRKFDPNDKYLEPLMNITLQCTKKSQDVGLTSDILYGNDTYSNTYDYVDFDMEVRIPHILKTWYTCFMEPACDSCDIVQFSFKAILPEAIKQTCAKCTAKQKDFLRSFIAALKEKYPADYNNFKLKFDPNDKYFKLFYLAKRTFGG